MGQRKSKASKTSYDVAPVVSDKDFKFAKAAPQNEQEGVQPVLVVAASELQNGVQPVLVVPETESQNGVQPVLVLPETESQNGVQPVIVVPASPEPPKGFEIDASVVPVWVTEAAFVEVLKQHVEGFEQIKSFKALPALTAGENFATLMLRISIEAELKDKSSKNLSYMMKVPHDTEKMKEMMGVLNFFTLENGMYFEIMPLVEQMYRDKGLDYVFAPKAYRYSAEPNSVLLEDLRPHGYKNTNRVEGLDMQHTERVLKKLAQFHAATASYVALTGPFSAMFMNGLFGDHTAELMEGFFKPFQVAFLDNIKNYKDGEKYYEVVKTYFDNMLEEMINMSKYNFDDFNVLNHGDCWSNNILFKYTGDGKIDDLRFVDYQGPKFGPPALDLLYFIISSVKLELKIPKFDHFIRVYYDTLVENLKLFGYPKKIPTLRDIHMQLFENGAMAMFPTVLTLPVVLLDSSDVSQFENIMSEDDGGKKFRHLLFTNKRYHDQIGELLPWLYNRGLLEYQAVDTRTDTHTDTTPKAIAVVATSISEAAPVEQVTLPKIPEWLTQEYFVDILAKNVKEFQEIRSFSVDVATNTGDNYASTLLQVDIVVELTGGATETLSYMLKVPPVGEHAKVITDKLQTFKREAIVYNEVLPKFIQLLEEAGSDVVLAPRSFKFTKDPGCETILLENLRPHGFQNADRLKGLDKKHVECVLQKLGQWHAVSAHYFATVGSYPEVLCKGMFNEETRVLFEKMDDSSFRLFIECVKNFEGSEKYIDKLNSYGLNFHKILAELYKYDENEFNVLNHGDCWTNNIMFKYDKDGNIEQTYFIDFQIPKFGSPAQDLYYFLLSSPALDIKLDQFDYFIRYYHEHLKQNLELLKYPRRIPKLKDLHIDLLKNGGWGITIVNGTMAAVLLEPTEVAKMENFFSQDSEAKEFKKLMYSSARYRSHAEKVLTWLNERGLLDFDFSASKPSWVNEDYFNDILLENVEGFSKILKLTADVATKTGDNYASIVLRVEIEAELKDGSTKNLAFMLKVPTSDVVLGTWDLFPKEIALYNEYLPEFERMYKEAGRPLRFAPKVFNFKKDPGCKTVLLEDLCPRGFTTANRFEGLDLEQTELVLRKLAQFHAASAKYIEQNGALPEHFNVGLYNENTREMFTKMTNMHSDVYFECVRGYAGHEAYIDKVEKLIPVVIDKAIEAFKVKPNEFNVLNHGDCWINNMMFQYDEEGKLTETFLIDYQVCKYGTPAQDLYNFLFSSTHLSLKVDKFEYFIKFYHDHLIESLELLQYAGKAPTLKELHTTLLDYGLLGFLVIMGMTSIVLAEANEKLTMDVFATDTAEAKEVHRALYSNERYKAHAELVYSWLDERGALNL